MKKLKIVSAFLTIAIALPIWFYIMYQVLDAVNASELTWFLYWVYIPVILVTSFIGRLLDSDGS